MSYVLATINDPGSSSSVRGTTQLQYIEDSCRQRISFCGR